MATESVYHGDLSLVVVVVEAIVVLMADEEAANPMVVLLGPIHHVDPGHPILFPNLCLYLHPSLSVSLMEVHLLDLSIGEGA